MGYYTLFVASHLIFVTQKWHASANNAKRDICEMNEWSNNDNST